MVKWYNIGMSHKIFPTIVSSVEFMMAGVFILGGIQTLFQDAITGTTRLQHALGSHVALVIYGVIYICVGIFLATVKVKDKRRLHGHALFIFFLVSLFSFILEFQVYDLDSVNYIDTLVLTLVSGVIYLRYKTIVRKRK